MLTFEVSDMSCGHCVAAIRRALAEADPQAKVEVDLAAHRVKIEQPAASAETLAAAIREAGYTPVALAAEES